jgi:organic radical activating enzyme
MLITEIFWSIQGEGLRIGMPSIFLRLSGCSLKCSNCDTKNSWQNGIYKDVCEIISEIDEYGKRYPESQVVITGGEPLEQDLIDVVKDLKSKDYFISIETNGVNFQDLEIDWWTISPKDVNDYYINENLFKRISEIKLIVNKNLNINIIKKIRKIGSNFPIFLQPDFYDKNKYKNTFSLFQKCQENGIKNVRLGIQVHKIFNMK